MVARSSDYDRIHSGSAHDDDDTQLLDDGELTGSGDGFIRTQSQGEESLLLSDDGLDGAGARVNPERSRYPYCIVWTPLPFLTWLFPFIGHMGIANSFGVIRDFAGSYRVNEDDMAFGTPTRYYQLDPQLATRSSPTFNQAVAQASSEFCRKEHNLFAQNCHSHVARALNLMRYDGRDDWNMVKVAMLVFLRAKYVGILGMLRTWLPFAAAMVVILLIAFVF